MRYLEFGFVPIEFFDFRLFWIRFNFCNRKNNKLKLENIKEYENYKKHEYEYLYVLLSYKNSKIIFYFMSYLSIEYSFWSST